MFISANIGAGRFGNKINLLFKHIALFDVGNVKYKQYILYVVPPPVSIDFGFLSIKIYLL